jgi:phage-Barnase-EndoU-ColicinE5/D-RelE like nuclease2/Phage Mu protein F like protein
VADRSAEYRSLPFEEAIDFLRQKVNVPSAKWADILEGAHARAFTVAGATKEGMLADFRTAIDKAIAQGTTLNDFRKDFDAIVQKYGWDYNGTRGWRTRVIYSTNLTTAYAAGRYRQMTDPDVLRYQPYWVYRHADGVLHPRPEHLAWNGLTLKAGDDWWKTHYPPNGWGCHCYVEPITWRELAASGKSGPDQAPPVELQQKTLNTSAGPLTISTPKGVDPGWGYNVGDAAFGRQLPADAMQAWRQQGAAAWERLTQGNWQSAGRPREIPADAPKAAIGASTATPAELERAIARAIGAPQKAIALPDGSTILVDAAALAQHMDEARGSFVPLLPELLADPYEIWLSFERHRGTGQVVLRKRVVKVVRLPGKQGMLLVAQASGGVMEAWTLIPTDTLGYLQRQRVGRLLWARG